jgi:hypothetical protein
VSRLASFPALFRPIQGRGTPLLPAVCLFLADLFLPQQEAYANPEYGFPMIAAVGAAGCIGYLLSAVSRLDGVPLGAGGPSFGLPLVAISSTNGRREGEDWPLLVALLFGSFLILFSGLGGWVEARPRGTGSVA